MNNPPGLKAFADFQRKQEREDKIQAIKEFNMHKTNSATHLKMIVSDMLSLSFQHMAAMANELKELDITEENMKDKSPAQIATAQTMSNMLTIINDVIHPAHDIAVQLFDKDVSQFVDYCIKNQALAIEKKLISDKCNCYSCKLKSKIGQ